MQTAIYNARKTENLTTPLINHIEAYQLYSINGHEHEIRLWDSRKSSQSMRCYMHFDFNALKVKFLKVHFLEVNPLGVNFLGICL